ncbi:dipeptidase [Arsenicicoccus sp. oral taxon 190]|uniref:dipeptidase n=1 Tax=Arsenicicoccus sp. oral taxon 190 TaxID=1658671 RepID=UPI000679FAF8|nr:dipeptidase [Arsenicicoccus sp. oral taxon 190]AKT52207.1 membrane dipeptidase [Arsenicicoccus sp. oral taxon 190]
MPDLASSPLPVLDTHNDLPWQLRERWGGDPRAVDLREVQSHLHTDWSRASRGGLRAQFWSVCVSSALPEPEAVVATLEQLDLVHRMISTYADRLALAVDVRGVEQAWRDGRLASLVGVEGGHSIGSSLAVLRLLHALGARYLTLTHNDNTPWADSATDEPEHGGLTAYGLEVVHELDRLGMVVDLSHVSADTMRAALGATRHPVIFSHSGARAVTDHVRNVPDDVLRTMAAGGGVCCVPFVARFVAADERSAGVADVVAHLEHVRELVGVEHVGLGADFDGTTHLAGGLGDVSTYPVLLDALRRRGWSRRDLEALGHRNVLRVLDAVTG